MYGEISLSLLCLHSSWGSAFNLAPPLRIGRLRASVLRLDRTGLKEQLIRGLWLTQAGGSEGYGTWDKPAAAEVSVMLGRGQCDVATACGLLYVLPRQVVPRSRDPGSGGLHRLLGWKMWIDVDSLAQRLLCGCSSSLSVSCLSLVSALLDAACACLWSSFRWCSESPLLAHPETMVSCLLGRSRVFLDSLLASCGALVPFRLCSRSQP